MKKKFLMLIVAIVMTASAVFAATEMPEWVFSVEGFADEDFHYEMGSAKQANFQQSLKRAKAAARDNMAEWIKVGVSEIITTYTNEAGETSDENKQAMEAFETLSIQKAEAVLSGCVQADMWFDKNGELDRAGTVYVLMKIPVENVKSQFYGALQDQSVQKQFKKSGSAKEANKMMSSAIDKYFAADKPSDTGK